MMRRPVGDNRFTPGERQLAMAYLSVSLIGAFLSLVIVLRLGQGQFIFHGPSRYGLWICLSGGLGAASGLYIVRHRLGHPGLSGAVQAVTGMILMCFAASLITGTLALPLYGTMFGPFMLAVTFIGSPFLAMMWFCALTGVHLLMLKWRSERDSIFVAANPAPTFRRGANVQASVTLRRENSGSP
jgi:lipid-A-disaccharide synthase-like uncharacterized protein